MDADKLTKLRRQQQELQHYPTSSPWYTSLSKAISFLQQAETADADSDVFHNAWSAIYNIFITLKKAGEEENKALSKWINEIKESSGVRKIAKTTSSDLLEAIREDKNGLMLGQARDQPREMKKYLDAWIQKRKQAADLSPEKACTYIFFIGRDIRNAISHPKINVRSPRTKKALSLARDHFVHLAAEAINATIERPLEGTTGRTAPYRSFLYSFLKNSDSFFSDYYLERLFPEKELTSFSEEEAKDTLKTIAREYEAANKKAKGAPAVRMTSEWLEKILFPTLKIYPAIGTSIIGEKDVFSPTYILERGDMSEKIKKEYRGKEAGKDLCCLFWIMPWGRNLDSVSADEQFAGLTVMEVAKRSLMASDVPWGVLTNGRRFRLIGKGTAHKPLCYIEADLETMIDRRGESLGVLAFRYMQGLFSGVSFTKLDDHQNSRLDRVLIGSERHGKEIGDELKQNVFQALEELGDGFLHYLRVNSDDLEALKNEKEFQKECDAFLKSEELMREIYEESLALMYRLLFLFYAESRDLLPMENDIYRETYSLEGLRDEVIANYDVPDPKIFFGKRETHLWDRFMELTKFVNEGWRKIVPAYNGGLFDPERHVFLERCKVTDYFFARAVDLLSRTRPRVGQVKGEGRKKITYRDLDIRHLGSIYEGILEYNAQIADENLVVMSRGSGKKNYEEYVPISQLNKKEQKQLQTWLEAVEENPENPKVPRGCNVCGLKKQSQYFLVYGGRESKRKSSGSYYTPDYIVQYIVENTLGPLIRGECRPKREKGYLKNHRKLSIETEPVREGPLESDEILELKVLDPAMGSGHFLVAATEYLARGYGAALIREGKDDDGVMSDNEFTRYKRLVAERCIYGVDINPLAVELAKLSIWLFTMDPGRPLSFLNHHLKCGNSLIGAWIEDLGELPLVDRKGRSKKRRDTDQMNIFEERFREKLPVMLRDLFDIMEKETRTIDDIQVKKELDSVVENLKKPFSRVAGYWVGHLFGEIPKSYQAILSEPVSAVRLPPPKAERNKKFFHWEIAFPEIFYHENGIKREKPGFDCVIGNPPYVFAREKLESDDKTFFSFRFHRTTKDKPNLYIMFLDLAIKVVRKNGYIGFIIPNAWLGVDSTEPLRKLLLDKSPPKRLIICLYPVFQNVNVETVVTLCQYDSTSSNCLCGIQLNEKNFGQNLIDSEISRWNKLSRTQFAVFTSREAGVLIDDIQKRCVQMCEVLQVRSALQAYETGKGTPQQSPEDVKNHVFDRNQKDSPETFKYLDGADVIRYGLKWSGRWLKYGPWLSQPREIEIFSKPRVLVREVTGKYPKMLLCTPVRDTYLNNKSIINLVCPEQNKDMLWVVAGILNSKLGSFIFKHCGVKANRGLFPKVVIADLQYFPIPKNVDKQLFNYLGLKVKQMVSLVDSGQGEDCNLASEIDTIVFKLYSLDPSAIGIIERETEVTTNATN